MTSSGLPRATSHLLFQLARAIGRQPAHAEFRWMQQTLSHPPTGIPPSGKNLEQMVARRVSGEPLQYILGEFQYESSSHLLATTCHVHACSEKCIEPSLSELLRCFRSTSRLCILTPVLTPRMFYEAVVLVLSTRLGFQARHLNTEGFPPSSWIRAANMVATHLILCQARAYLISQARGLYNGITQKGLHMASGVAQTLVVYRRVTRIRLVKSNVLPTKINASSLAMWATIESDGDTPRCLPLFSR